MTHPLPRITVTALRGGSGKTTLSLGLIQALRDRGQRVAPFKKGPDYIDPFWHSEAAGIPCRNLDPYLMGQDQVCRSFGFFAVGADCAVIEGNRGLYDGMDAQGSYSTAELAKWLGSPVILALDCSMASRTVAASVLGCQSFDPNLDLAGVILNPVGNPRQESVIRRAIEDSTGLPVLGAVPRLKIDLPERHMGLVPPQEHSGVAAALRSAGRTVAGYVDLDRVWEIMLKAPAWAPLDPPDGLFPATPPTHAMPTIGVVRDAAFGFYYPENLEALELFGAKLVYCSALEEAQLPPVDGLYIGGGFPETHAARLEANQGFRDSVRRAAAAGLPIYAECGGFMYLGRSIKVGGTSYAMAGVFPVDFEMHPKPQGHGYTACRVSAANPFLDLDIEFKGHAFHYSSPQVDPAARLDFAYLVQRGRGIAGTGGGLLYRNVLGTYHHVHCLGLPTWAPGLVAAARRRAEVA